MDPFWIRVVGDFVPRGGISIVTVAEYKRENFTIPDHFKEMPANLHTRHM
jgi:NADPH-dependent 7-cyano-7-deazaguanine reductase QueF